MTTADITALAGAAAALVTAVGGLIAVIRHVRSAHGPRKPAG